MLLNGKRMANAFWGVLIGQMLLEKVAEGAKKEPKKIREKMEEEDETMPEAEPPLVWEEVIPKSLRLHSTIPTQTATKSS